MKSIGTLTSLHWSEDSEELGARARELVAEGALLLDVRTDVEFAAGHIPEALNIPMQELPHRLEELGAKDRAIVLYCRSGARSARAATYMRSAGFDVLCDLGPMSAWNG